MAEYPIKALGALGVIADLAPTDLPPNAFTDAINARFIENRVFKTGGSSPLSYVDEDKALTPLSFLSMPFDYFSSGKSFLIVGDNKKLYKLSNEMLEDVSRKVAATTKKATAQITIHPKLSGLSFTQNIYQVELGKSVDLSVTLNPSNVRSPALTWTVSNSALGTITPKADKTKATFTAKTASAGTVTVTVSNQDRTIEADVYVNVIDTANPIFLSQDTMTLRNGGTGTLFATITGGAVTWTSSNTNLLSITPSPNDPRHVTLSAHGTGGAVDVTAHLSTGKTATCRVTVIPQIDSINLTYQDLTISAGVEATIEARFNPPNAVNKKVNWTNSNANVLMIVGQTDTTVTVKALKPGIANITGTTVEGGRTASCEVTISLQDGITPGNVNPSPRSFVQNDYIDDVEDFTYVMDLEGLGQMLAQAPPARLLNSIKLSITQAEIDVDDTISVEAIVDPVSATDLIYQWKVDQSGIVSTTSTTDAKIHLTALSSTYTKTGNTWQNNPLTITCTVVQQTDKDYAASEEHPWYHAIIANCAVATTYEEIPQVKLFNQERFQDLPGWGEQTVVDQNGNPSVKKYNWKCERVRAFNNRLFALNMREANASGVVTHYPLRIRWSNFANENEAPLLWDDSAYNRETTSDLAANIIGQVEALENGYAGYIDLADSNGNLIEMLPLRDYLFVYTEFETYVGSPTMNTYQPLMWKKLFNDSGILAPECVCEVEGGHFVVTQNDIILHNGTSKKSLASNRVKDKIINEICQVNPMATKVHLHQDKKEVWILYVGPGQEKGSYACTKAAVWNYEYDTWSFRTIPLSYCVGLVDPPTLEKGPIWDDFLQLSWTDPKVANLVWSKDVQNFHKRITIIGSKMKGFYQVDIGPWDYSWDNRHDVIIKMPLEMRLERSGIDFDNATNEWNQKHVNTFRPQVSGRGKYTFVTGGSQYSNEMGHRHSVKDYTIGKDRLVCVRLNHPYLFYNVIDNDIDSDASINGITIEYQIGGRR